MIFKGILPSKQKPKTINEKNLEEEQKVLEEKQKKITIEYKTNIQDLEKKYKECISEPWISPDQQRDCYKKHHQKVDDLKGTYNRLPLIKCPTYT
jgi:hypothetical protein